MSQSSQARIVRAPEDAPSPGVGRRDGPGFVTSFGTGRRCAAEGCETGLSRYNERPTCFVHSASKG